MKTLKTLAILTVSGAALLFASCSETESIDESMELAKSAEMAEEKGVPADTCTYDGTLTTAEIEGLKLMREEEKLANDVYFHFFELYGEAVFENIAKSEEAHMNAVLSLLEGYGIEDPALNGVGEFSNQELATLYTELITEGEKGLVEALKVGATIEDLDINDLQDLLLATVNENVKRVYENLLAGSENHMRAFVGVLDNLGESYSAHSISDEELEAILNAEKEKGNQQGNGSNSTGNVKKGTQGQKGNKGNSQNGTGAEDCDGTQTGAANGNQSGSVDGTQTGSQNGNQNSSQNGNSNGSSGSNNNSNSNGNGNK